MHTLAYRLPDPLHFLAPRPSEDLLQCLVELADHLIGRDARIALQPHHTGLSRRRDHVRKRRLATPRRTLDNNGLLHFACEKDRFQFGRIQNVFRRFQPSLRVFGEIRTFAQNLICARL